ncbi:Potassium transporter [Asimina triloba]
MSKVKTEGLLIKGSRRLLLAPSENQSFLISSSTRCFFNRSFSSAINGREIHSGRNALRKSPLHSFQILLDIGKSLPLILPLRKHFASRILSPKSRVYGCRAMDVESGSRSRKSRFLKTYKATLSLAYQSFGVVYGDLSTSPIYVFKSSFTGSLRGYEDDGEVILGVLSLIFWTLTLIPLLKYIILVLGADDNGEGGTFALYSLLCRNSKMCLLNTAHVAHEQLSVYNSGGSSKETRTSTILKEFFERHHCSRIILFLVVLSGTSMVIGDGILTPTMSDYTVFIACVLLVGLFALQHYGTHRVGFLFAPIVMAWLLCISGVGIYNTVHWNPSVVKALSPYYAYKFFRKVGMDGYRSLGGILLCVTGAEAMFADLGHFSKLSVRSIVKSEYKDIPDIDPSYCLAVVTVMFVTTCLMFLIITIVWKRTVLAAMLFVIAFGSIELLYLSSSLLKVPDGGWFPLLLSSIILFVMSIWHYGTSKKDAFESQNKVCIERLLSLGHSLGIVRVPGIGLIYSNVMNGVTPMFAHFVTNFPAFHRILVFVTLQSLTVPKVPPSEQFLIGRIGPPEYLLFRCIIRYGYKDPHRDCFDFENQLIMKVAEFLQQEDDEGSCHGRTHGQMAVVGKPSSPVADAMAGSECNGGVLGHGKKVGFKGVGVREEVKELLEAKEAGVAYMMGHTCVVASEVSSIIKKFAIDFVYGFMRRNCRRPAVPLGIPHTSLIEVGMVYKFHLIK